MSATPQVLLAHHVKVLKLPTLLREHTKLARQCAAVGADHLRYLLRLAALELVEREGRMLERRIRTARFAEPCPATERSPVPISRSCAVLPAPATSSRIRRRISPPAYIPQA